MYAKTVLGFALCLCLSSVGLGQLVCPPGQVCPPVNPYAGVIITQSAPVAAVVADHPHARVIAGNSCGSGTICGSDGDGSYVVTNAHVVGTQIGRVVAIDIVSEGAAKKISGRTVMAGYSDSRMVDFAIVFCEGLSSKRYMPMLKAQPASTPFTTTGAPRCVWPLVTKQFNDPRNYGDGLITGTPNAIGGQSGSAIYNAKGQQIALLTWSISGRCAGQKTIKLWEVATSRNVQLADRRPAGLEELCDTAPEERPKTESGVFGDCVLFGQVTPAAVGQRPLTENTISNVVGAAMEDLPIWVGPDPPTEPPIDPPTDPDCPPVPPTDPEDPDCMKVTASERALIEFIRKQATAEGEVAIDWMQLIAAIMEIIRIIQEGRA